MFRRLSENVVYSLTRRKVLDVEAYDIYTYAVEVILLNGGLLFTCLLISAFFNAWLHYLAFLVFFVPLRMLSGGYHCKKSETCFLCSNGVYLLSVIWIRYMQNEYVLAGTYVSTAVAIVLILAFAPVINKNHPLTEQQIKRNKKLLYGIVLLQIILYVLFYSFHISIIFSQMVFVSIVAIILCIGVFEQRVYPVVYDMKTE